MIIERVEIENFRSIRRATVDLERLTTIVGRNGVGKSTLLYALDSFYNVGAQYSELDYYNHEQTDADIRIRVTYGSLAPEELAEFGPYMVGDKLTVSKVINSGGARYYGTVAQIPALAECRRLGANDKRARLRFLVEDGSLVGFPEIPRKNDDVDAAMAEYERQHLDLTRPIERETQFFGPRNVGGGKLDKYTKFVLVPAVKDAATEVAKRGAIMQLLDAVVARSIGGRAEFIAFKEEFERKARELYGRDNVPELAALSRAVTDRLRRYAPGAELHIDFEDLKAPTIPLPDASVTVSEENFRVPVPYSGHGLQRALVLALLEQLSVSLQGPVDRAGQGGEGQEAAVQAPNLILAIEEPELYLHPARGRYLARILRELSARRDDLAAPGTQVICVTHSPYFVDVNHFDEVRMCRKVPAAAPDEPRETTFVAFSRHAASQRMAALTGRDAANFTAQTFAARAAGVLNSLVNEGLFADVAVVVEGDSDAAALWAIQAQRAASWDELGVVIVPVGGKSKIDRVVVTFQGFGIPTHFVFDGDRSENADGSLNRLLLRLGQQPEADFPDTASDELCACFGEDIESYLQGITGARFQALRAAAAAKLGVNRPGEALKNAEVMAQFVSDASLEGFRFPVLEAIVDTVTRKATDLRARPH